MQARNRIVTAVFLLTEVILYILLLTFGGNIRVCCSYAAIVLCFAFAIFNRASLWILCGLACTVAADFFLVVCAPAQQLWGMVFFSGTQIFYGIFLQRTHKSKLFLLIRLLLITVAEAAAVLVLGKKLDALAVVSMFYYANLIASIIQAFACFSKQKRFAFALVLFLLCDTVIGLQAAAGAYLPISEGALIYKIIFMDFHLSWFFYLPSQVLIAMQKGRNV